MRQIVDASAASLVPFVPDSVEPGSVIRTDGWLGYLPRFRDTAPPRFVSTDVVDLQSSPAYEPSEVNRCVIVPQSGAKEGMPICAIGNTLGWTRYCCAHTNKPMVFDTSRRLQK